MVVSTPRDSPVPLARSRGTSAEALEGAGKEALGEKRGGSSGGGMGVLASEPAESREGTRRWVECSWEGGGECWRARRLVGCCSGGGGWARERLQGRGGVDEGTASTAAASKSSSSVSSTLPRRLDPSLVVLH